MPTSIQELFTELPKSFQPDKAGDLTAVIQFELSGEGGGNYYLNIANGTCTSTEGTAPDANITMIASAEDYLAIANGTMNPMQAFMQGRLRAQGDMALGMRMMQMFGR